MNLGLKNLFTPGTVDLLKPYKQVPKFYTEDPTTKKGNVFGSLAHRRPVSGEETANQCGESWGKRRGAHRESVGVGLVDGGEAARLVDGERRSGLLRRRQ